MVHDKLLVQARSRNAEAQYVLGLKLFEDTTRIDEAFEWFRYLAKNCFVNGVNDVPDI